MKLQVFEWVGGGGVCLLAHTKAHAHEGMCVIIAFISTSPAQPVLGWFVAASNCFPDKSVQMTCHVMGW